MSAKRKKEAAAQAEERERRIVDARDAVVRAAREWHATSIMDCSPALHAAVAALLEAEASR